VQQHLSPEDLRELGWADEQGHWLNSQHWKTPEQGAATSIWAAVDPELEGIGGRYLEDCQVAAPYDPAGGNEFHGYMPYALDPERAERLWTISQDLVGL
jgi:hypothetical protein